MIYAFICICLGALVVGFAFGVNWRGGEARKTQKELVKASSEAMKEKDAKIAGLEDDIAILKQEKADLQEEVVRLTPVRDHGKYARKPSKTWAEVKNLAENPPEAK